MSNNVSKVTFYVEELFRSNPLVNTISFERTEKVDFNKENIYPLINIDALGATVEDQLIFLNYDIMVLEQRDITPVLNNDKMYGSNFIDNLNECTFIAVKFINAIRRLDNEDNIDVVTITDLTFIRNEMGNGLDGVSFNIQLSIHNDISAC